MEHLCVLQLDDFGRSKIYIIDHNPSWKENQRQKREFLDPRVANITSGRHKQPEALKSLYRSPGYKKNQLVLCKNYVLQW